MAQGKKPEDFLKEFGEFIRAKRNEIAALSAVLTRPRELTRKQLRELRLALDTAGYPESEPRRRVAGQDQSGDCGQHPRLHPSGGARGCARPV